MEWVGIERQVRTPLFDALKNYHKQNIIPFDVPGHKHGKGISELAEYFGKKVLEVDVNSMKELDNLSNPVSVIKEAQELMAEAYGSDYAFFLVNGTTCGVQSMIMSVCKPGDKIILPRNAHKSTTNGLIMSGAIPIYIQPEIDQRLGIAMGITVESVEKAIDENPDAKAVFVINPTYYGAVSDLKSIIKLCHDRDIAVLVDEAHGAHLKFNKKLPCSAMELGADMAAVSLHKTGGSLTQSSALLLNEGRIIESTVRAILNLTQTTSASYLLMSSLDVCRKNLVLNGDKIFDRVIELVDWARREIDNIPGLYAFGKELIDGKGVYDFDVTKLGVNVSGLGMTGLQVYDILRDKYNIQAELGDIHNILAIVSVGDDENSIKALVDALKDISVKYKSVEKESYHIALDNPQIICSPREAFYSEKEMIPIDKCEGRVSGESIMAYPPGIPIIAPGEKITREMIDYIKLLKSEESMLSGSLDPYCDFLMVLLEN